MVELEGVATGLELCYKFGDFVVKKCQNWRRAEAEVDERINTIEAIWDKTRQQTNLLHRIDHVLDDEYRRIVDHSIGLLSEKLSAAITSLERVVGNEHGKRIGFHGFGIKVKRGKYAFLKETLDEIIEDLEKCHRKFDPSWFLLVRLSSPVIDEHLRDMTAERTSEADGVADRARNAVMSRRPVDQQSPLTIVQGMRAAIHTSGPVKSVMRDYLVMERIRLPFSTATLAARWSASKGENLSFIIDSLQRCSNGSVDDLETDVRSLAKRLANSDPYTFGLLKCKCPMYPQSGSKAPNSFELVLHVPDGMENPTSLRQMLLSTNDQLPPLSLTRRLRIAQQVANSISYVHDFKFVHKGVCPESILVFEGTQGTGTIQHLNQKTLYTFLVGFGDFRAADGGTARIGDTAWEKNIYRHPQRQGLNLKHNFRMQHDVYSLGVCLLEIGLWESFVEYHSDTEPFSPQDSRSYKQFQSWVSARGDSSSTEDIDTRTSSSSTTNVRAALLREYLVEMAETRLPSAIGELYKDVVVACLSSGGGETESSEDELDREAAEDKEGISVGVHFIVEILGKLEAITL
ncbi:hypothetical protein CC79DRAFT_1338235 [Sarocladium strictum]